MENSKSIPQKFQLALEHHRAGRLADAQALYKEILVEIPEHFDSNHLLGTSLIQTGQVEKGIDCIRRALTINPNYPEAQYNLGHGLSSLGQYEQAIPCFQAAIALNSHDPEYYLELASALAEMKSLDAALSNYDKAIKLKPNYADALAGRAKVLRMLDRLDEALANYNKIIALRPRDAEGYNGRGQILKDLAQYDEALRDYETAISLKPDHAEAYLRLGILQRELGRPRDAVISHEKAISLKPGYVDAYNSRGTALRDLRQLDEALASFETAIDLAPDHAYAHINRALLLKDLNHFDEALAGYNRAIGLKSDLAVAHYNKSLLLLHRQNYLEGFELYSWRWKKKNFNSKTLSTNIPRWTGSPMTGKLLLWPEQGLGDEVFFSSFLSLVRSDTMEITLSADRRLHAIYARSFPTIHVVDSVLQDDAPVTDFTEQAPIGDLGHLLKITSEKLSQRKYPFLTVNQERKDELISENDFLRQKFVCGIAWRSANKKIGEGKSIALDDLEPLLRTSDATFVNLQYGDVADEIERVAGTLGSRVHQVPGLDVFHDIDGLLSLIDACDIVLTTSNVTAHLAGAIGKKAAVLVPKGKSRLWYWHDQPQSIWYPSLRLFNQGENWDWSDPVLRAASWIRENMQWTG